jgi:ABC-2 type transport system permease protein
MVSSRVNDPRVAEQISTLVILPLIGLMMAQTFGLIYLDETMIFWIAVAMMVIDTGLIYFAIQLFQRETILTRSTEMVGKHQSRFCFIIILWHTRTPYTEAFP